MKKRLTSLLASVLSVAMIVNLCVIPAFAVEDFNADNPAAEASEIQPEEEIEAEDTALTAEDPLAEETGDESAFEDIGNDEEEIEADPDTAEPDQAEEAESGESDEEPDAVAEDEADENSEEISESSALEEQNESEEAGIAPDAENGEESVEPAEQETDREREAREKALREGSITPMATSDPDSSEHMWYQYNGNIDIRGYTGSSTIQTTYSDAGYYTVLTCDDTEETLSFNQNGDTASHSSGLTVTPSVEFSEDGSYAIVKYTVKNTTDSKKKFSLGVHADVDISSDDYATVSKTSHGLRMVNRSNGRTYYLVCKGVSGSIDADTLWFGYYSDRRSNVFNNTSLNELTNTDSGLAFSWKNKTIVRYSTIVFAYQIGIGESGSIVDYSEEGKGFTIGEDTNAFSHSISAFFDGEWKNDSDVGTLERIGYHFTFRGKNYAKYNLWYVTTKEKEPDGLTYKTSSNYYNRLVSGWNNFMAETIYDEMYSIWGGSCHGMAVSMALASQNEDILSAMGVSEIYHKAGNPKEKNNKQLRDAINFYQLSQYTISGRETDIVYASKFANIVESRGNLTSFLSALVHEGIRSETEKKPFVFSFGTSEGGHSIVAYGIVEEDTSHYRLKLYDENDETDIDGIEMTINLDNGNFSFTDGNGEHVSNSNFKYLSYTGIDDLYSKIATMEATETEEHDQLIISAMKKVLITNDRGEYLRYDGSTYTGTMNVYDMRVVGEGDNQKIIFYVDSYESIEMSEMDERVKLQAGIGEEYYTVEVEDADAVFVQNGKIEIEGEDYTFTAGTSAGTENTDLLKVSAAAKGKTVLEAGEGDVSVTSENELSNALVTTYDDLDMTETNIRGNTNNIDVKDNEEGTLDVDSGDVSYDLASCDITLSKTTYTYSGSSNTPEVTVSSGDFVLEKDTDFTVSYENNVNVGTATVTITGIGSCTGTVTKTFMILLGKTGRGDMFNLANNVKVTWQKVPGAKYYKVYRYGLTDTKETRRVPVIVTTGLVGWDKEPGLTNGHKYKYTIIASLTGKGDSSGDSELYYTKLMYRLKTVVIRSAKNTVPGGVLVKYDKTTSGDSYVLQYSDKADMSGAKTRVVKGANTTSYMIGGLKKGKTYYISIRVRKTVDGINYYTTFGVPTKVTITK